MMTLGRPPRSARRPITSSPPIPGIARSSSTISGSSCSIRSRARRPRRGPDHVDPVDRGEHHLDGPDQDRTVVRPGGCGIVARLASPNAGVVLDPGRLPAPSAPARGRPAGRPGRSPRSPTSPTLRVHTGVVEDIDIIAMGGACRGQAPARSRADCGRRIHPASAPIARSAGIIVPELSARLSRDPPKGHRGSPGSGVEPRGSPRGGRVAGDSSVRGRAGIVRALSISISPTRIA